MILYRRRPSTDVPLSLRLKLTRGACGHPGPPETDAEDAQRTSSAALDWGPRYPNLALQTRHSMWSIIFFALVIINTWMLAVRSAVAPFAAQLSNKTKKDGETKKVTLHPLWGGCRKSSSSMSRRSFETTAAPNDALSQLGIGGAGV